MLLFVIDPKLGKRGAGSAIECSGFRQPFKRRVDMGAISGHRLERRPGQQTAKGTRMPRPLGLVIGIEAIVKAVVEDAIA